MQELQDGVEITEFKFTDVSDQGYRLWPLCSFGEMGYAHCGRLLCLRDKRSSIGMPIHGAKFEK